MSDCNKNMNKLAFVFPGQGTYYIGMGKSFYDNYAVAREVFEIGSKITGIDLATMCFEGPDSELFKTENQQPAVITVEIAMYNVLKEKGIIPDLVAGFSLGEYSALTAAETFKFEDTISLVRERGLLMSRAVPENKGSMLTIHGASIDIVRALVAEVNSESWVEISIINSPVRTTVSGWNEGIMKLEQKVEALGYKAKRMQVSGPFHTEILDKAAAQIRKLINLIDYNEPKCEYVPNCYGRLYTENDNIPEILELHTSRAVLWQSCIEEMIRLGVNTIVEVGPKRGLTNLNEEILKDKNVDVKLYNIQTVDDMDKFLLDYKQ